VAIVLIGYRYYGLQLLLDRVIEVIDILELIPKSIISMYPLFNDDQWENGENYPPG